MKAARRLAFALASTSLGIFASALFLSCRPTAQGAASPRREPLWIVDVGLAKRYPQIGLAIDEAGGKVLAFDFPGAALPSGDRYSWVRDYGPLGMPGDDGSSIWDARAGGSTTPELEHQALRKLAAALGVEHRDLDFQVQGGNWLPLPDGRVITSSRFFHDNRGLGSRAAIEDRVRVSGVLALIEIAPLPGELTQHADMVMAVETATGRVFVGEVWQAAIDLIPSEPAWDMYREISSAMRDSLERTTVQLRSELGAERVHRFPQPLPYLDRHPTEDRYRPNLPSFVNGIFVVVPGGRTTYLYGLSRDGGKDYYSFDDGLVDDYVAAVETVATTLGFAARGVETGDLVRNGGGIHCATVETPFKPTR